jgi:hypothetical protein
MVYKKAYLVTHQLHGSSIIGFQWMDHGALVGAGSNGLFKTTSRFHHFKIFKNCSKSYKGLF